MADHEGVHEIEELIGAYALDAVDPDERAAVEQHLTVCPRCRAELADHREVAAFLAYDGTPAPTDMWDRIVLSLEEPPPAMRLKLDTPGTSAEVVSLDERRRITAQQRVMAAIASVAAVVALVLGVVVVRQDTTPAVTVDLAQLAGEAMADPASSQVTLSSPDGLGPSATAVVTPDGDGYILAPDLPALGSNRTYQLWGVVQDQAVSLGVLGSDPDVAAFRIDDESNFAAFAITDEVSGGVVSSENSPTVVGETV